MKSSEVRAIARELAEFCAKGEWGMQTYVMALPIHERLSSVLADVSARSAVREALSRELEALPSEDLACFVVIHALEDGDVETVRMLANHPNAGVRHGVVGGLVEYEVQGNEFVVEAMRDVSPRLRELACKAFNIWGYERKGPVPVELFAATLADPDPGVRSAAAHLVGGLFSDKNFDEAPFLARFGELLDSDESIAVKRAAASAIRNAAKFGVNVDPCMPVLRRHADSPDSPVASVASGILRCLATGKYPARRHQP